MKLFEITEKWDAAEHYKKVALKLMREAKPFISEVGEPLEVAYRGYAKFDSSGFHRPYRDNRMPKDSSPIEHNFFNAAIKEVGGIANRSNSIFVSGDPLAVKKYGEIYVIFPIGDFNYTYHTMAIDWYNNFGAWSETWSNDTTIKSFTKVLKMIKGKDPKQVAQEFMKSRKPVRPDSKPYHLRRAIGTFERLIDGIKVDTNLRQALNDRVEIMLSAKGGYYYVPLHFYNKYVKEYFKINGIQVE